MRRTWRVWLAEGAERDFFSVLRWTTEQFGKRQARVYETTLRNALKALASGPSVMGCRARPDLGSDIASLHVARQGRKGRRYSHLAPETMLNAADAMANAAGLGVTPAPVSPAPVLPVAPVPAVEALVTPASTLPTTATPSLRLVGKEDTSELGLEKAA